MKTLTQPRRTPALRPLALAIALLGGVPGVTAQSLPQGPSVASGQASFVTQGTQLTVTNSANAIVNWQSFSIGAGHAVRFEQPHASSRVLNRVLGRDPSQIFGQLSSNGEVWLLNPHGVLFGAGARVDVASLVASTLNIADADWQAQRLRLFAGTAAGGGDAQLVNQGELRTTAGGRLMLVGGAGGVRNEGTLEAPQGQLVLAAGAAVDLADSSSPQIAVRVSAPAGQVLNLGRLAAPGGRIDLQAAMVNQQGIVRADSLAGGSAGEVVLRASVSADLAGGSDTGADGGQGGRVRVEAPTVLAAGQVSATGASGRGGSVQFTGAQIGLLDGARIDASGAGGGGEVTVGGGVMGRDPLRPNAQAVYMAPGASIAADATSRGDGGSIVLWSDLATRAYGRFSARGGALGGDGGFVETSGGWLDARPAAVVTAAPLGRPGQWLLDPNDILIVNGGPDTHVGTGPNFTTTDDSAVISTSTLVAALNAGNNVTITTGTGGANSQPGDVTFSGATLVTAPGAAVTLTVNAARHVDLVSSSITSSGAPLSVVLNAAGSGVGAIGISGSTIDTHGGSLSLGGSGSACGAAGCAPFAGAVATGGRNQGVHIVGSTLAAGQGSITIRGAAAHEGAAIHGVEISPGSVLSARAIDIAGWAGGQGFSDQTGVRIAGPVTATQTLDIAGTSRLAGDGDSGTTSSGVRIGFAGEVVLTPSAPDPGARLRVAGTTDERSTGYSYAIDFAGRLHADHSAAVTVSGQGGPIVIYGSSPFDTSGASALTITGSGTLESFRSIELPGGGPFTVSTQAGAFLFEGYVGGSPSSVLIDVPSAPVVIGGSGYGATLDGGSAPVTVRAGEFTLGDSFGGGALYGGSIHLRSPVVRLLGSAYAAASDLGDAIVVAGLSGNATTFVNESGSGAFSTPNGNWKIWATDPEDLTNFDAGGLSHDFRQYNATFGGAVLGSGNGLLFSIAPVLGVSGSISPFTRPYDGTTDAPVALFGLELGGLIGNDFPVGPVTFVNPRFASKDAAPSVPILVSLAGGLPLIRDGSDRPVYGYGFSGEGPDLFGTITPRPISVGGVSVLDKRYDGTRDAFVTGGIFSGLVAGESLTLGPGTLMFDTKDVGNSKPVSGVFTLADGPNGRAANYALADGGAVVATANILPKLLDVTGISIAEKVYDGSTAAQAIGGTLEGLVAGETLLLSLGSAEFADKNAGAFKTVTLQAALFNGSGGGLASNYELRQGSAVVAQGHILPRPLAFVDFTAQSREYDGTRAATLVGGSLSGLLPGEALGFTAGGLFDTKDAGTAKSVTPVVTLADGAGGLAANYTVDAALAPPAHADITPRAVTVAGTTVVSRPYDGTRNASFTGVPSISGTVGAETLGLNIGAALFDTKDAGTGKTVTATVSLADGGNGGLAGNYRLADGPVITATGTITPRLLTLSSLSAADKVYDGTLDAAIVAGTLQGLVAGETLQATFTGLFDTKNAGSGKTVSAVASIADGSGLASNYQLGPAGASTTASILPRPVTVSGVFALDKAYDGTTAATLAGSSFAGLVAGESLTLAGQAQFSDRNAGSGKQVTGTIALGDGAGGLATNYTLTNPGSFSGSAAIVPRGLTVLAATAADKTYDGTTSAQVGNFQLGGVIGADQVSVTAGSGAFADPHVGDAKPVTATASALGGADAANYALAQPSVQTQAGIRPAQLVYVASPAFASRGGPIPLLAGSVSGFVGGDTLQSATNGTLLFTTTAQRGDPEGSYAVAGGGLTARNYLFAQAPGNATALTIIPMSTATLGENTAVQPSPAGLLATLLPLPLTTQPEAHRSLDVTPALRPTVPPAPTPGVAFRTFDFGAMTQGDLAMTLSARDRYKKSIFAEALARLERNPELADLPACQTVEQAATGDCLITEALKPALRERILRDEAALMAAATAPAPAAPPAPGAVAAPAAPAAAPPTPAPAAAPAVPVAPVPAPAPAVAPPPALPPVAIAPPAAPRLLPVPEVVIRVPAPRPVLSASLPQIRRKLALVIGTDRYADARIPQLDNAVGDAEAVAAVLESTLGYQAVIVRDGSRSAIVKAFNQLAATAAPEDSVIVYYAGHGELVDKTGLGYWQPADADASRPETWLSNTDIGKLLGQFGASQVALIADSCFSGSLVSDERIRAGGALPDPAAVLSRRAAVVMSSGGNEPVADSGKNGHSTFAWSLMRTLERVSAWRPGGNVFEQVRFAVAREVPQRPQYGASQLGGHQSGTDYLFEQRQLEAPPR